MESLKPCPFCAGQAIVECRSSDVDDRGHFQELYEARCLNCGAKSGSHYISDFYRENGEFVFLRDGYSDAVAAWNTRAGDA